MEKNKDKNNKNDNNNRYMLSYLVYLKINVSY